MFLDYQTWNMAAGQFRGFAANLPSSPDEDHVSHYNGIIKLLEEASGQDLSVFRIAPERLKSKIASVIPETEWGPGQTRYTQKRFVEASYFRSQVSGLLDYLKFLVDEEIGDTKPDKKLAPREPAYRSLPDYRLEQLAVTRRIKPKMGIDPSGTDAQFDREYIIAALMKLDRGVDQAAPASVSNYTYIERMENSAVVQGSPGSSIAQTFGVRGEELKNLVESLRGAADDANLTQTQRAEIEADFSTLDAQASSPNPKPGVVRECLSSVRAILENAAGNFIGSAAYMALLSAMK